MLPIYDDNTQFNCPVNPQNPRLPVSKMLPKEIIFHILSNIDTLIDLKSCSCIDKIWNKVTNNPLLWKMPIYKEFAFGINKKGNPFEKDAKNEEDKEIFLSLPNNIVNIYRDFKILYPKNEWKDLRLVWIQGNSLIRFSKYLSPAEYFYNPLGQIFQELEKNKPGESGWFWLVKGSDRNSCHSFIDEFSITHLPLNEGKKTYKKNQKPQKNCQLI